MAETSRSPRRGVMTYEEAGARCGGGICWGPGDMVAPPQVSGQLISLFGKDDGDFENNAPIDCAFQVPPRGTQASGRGRGKPVWRNRSSGVRQGAVKGRGGVQGERSGAGAGGGGRSLVSCSRWGPEAPGRPCVAGGLLPSAGSGGARAVRLIC